MVVFILSILVGMVSASLYVKHVEGSAGVKDYRAMDDTVSFNISSTSNIISINGEVVSCVQESLNYYCAITDVQDKATVMYTITNQEGNTASASIDIDNSIGTIIYSVSNNNGNATLNYDITDTSYNNGQGCSGLSRVDVWWQGSNTDVIEFDNNNCRQTGTRTLAISDSGTAEFYLDVFDKIGNNKKSAVNNLSIDVSMPEISSLEILNNGIPLDVIAQNTDFLVDVEFDITENNLSSVNLDLSDINTNPAINIPYKNINVPLSSCIANMTDYGKIYHCVVAAKILRVNKESVIINVTAKDSSGNSITQTLEKSFSIDNVIPEIEIITDYCDEDKCYVKNGLNKFIFQLTKDNFEKKQIYFDVDGVNSRVLNCSGGECTGFANINCNGPTQIRILTASPFLSQDDSGNKLSSFSRTLYCDNSVPQITNISWDSSSQLGEGLLVTGTTVSLIVKVNEPDSKVIASAYFDRIKNETIPAECTESTAGLANTLANTFDCSWSLSPINDGYYDANVLITAQDIVNNSLTKTSTVRILGLNSDNETPNLLKAAYSRTVPESINRVTLQLAAFNNIPMYAYAYYTITLKQGIDVELLSQELSVDNCVLRDTRGNTDDASLIFSEVKLADIYKKLGEENRIDFTFGSSESYNMFSDGTRVICNVSAYVREGKYVYNTPQILPIEIKFTLRNSELSAPGEEYVKRIKELEESTTSDYSSLLANLDSFMVTAQNICTIKGKLDYAEMTGVGIQLAGMGLGLVGGTALKTAGGQVVELMSNVNSVFYDPHAVEDKYLTGTEETEPPLMGLVGQACTFMSCNLDWNNPLTLDAGLAKNIEHSLKDLPLGVGTELTEGLVNSNLKNSLVLSAQKLCIPGVVYNLNKYRQVDCEYLECLKVYSASGLDVSQCEVMKASKTCSIIVGEAFELPYVRIGKNLFSNFADTVRMSYGYGLSAFLDTIASSDICKDVTSDTAIITCNVPHAIKEYLSGQKKTRMSKDFYYEKTRDFCESAGCVGADCYSSNSVLGIPLPQYVPNSEQQATLNAYKRFGPLAANRYLLIDAFGSSDLDTKKNKLEEWNNLIKSYNNEHNTKYQPINLQESSEKDLNKINIEANTQISNYFKNFDYQKDGSDVGTKEDGSGSGISLTSDPRLEYKKAIDDQLAFQHTIESNSLFIGIVDKKINDKSVEDNIKIDVQKNYDKLKKVLPFGSELNVYENSASANTRGEKETKYYYFEDNNLMYHDEDKKTELKILEYEPDGYPKYDSNGNPIVIDVTTLSEEWKGTEFAKRLVDKNGKNIVSTNAIDLKDKKVIYLEKNKAREDAREKYRVYMLKQKAEVLVDILLSQLGLKKFLTADYWAEKYGGVHEYITTVADAADPEIWKNNLCNPENGPLYAGNDQPEGTVYSCYNSPGEGCKLVLTYGAEYFDYGNNTNLYTITYLVGTVPQDVQFNIRLKGPSGTINGFAKNKFLKAFSYDSKADVLLSKDTYDRICVYFTGNFPDKRDPAQEFCRSIKEDVFRTGNPPLLDETTTGYPSGNYGSGSSNSLGFFE